MIKVQFHNPTKILNSLTTLLAVFSSVKFLLKNTERKTVGKIATLKIAIFGAIVGVFLLKTDIIATTTLCGKIRYVKENFPTFFLSVYSIMNTHDFSSVLNK
jgi:hypothetical protein